MRGSFALGCWLVLITKDPPLFCVVSNCSDPDIVEEIQNSLASRSRCVLDMRYDRSQKLILMTTRYFFLFMFLDFFIDRVASCFFH